MASCFPAQTHPILGNSREWHFRDSIRVPQDLGRYCKDNSAIEFNKEGTHVSFCVLVSASCSHIAAVEVNPSEKTIEVTVYHLDNGYEQKWTVTHRANDSEFQASESRSWYDAAKIHGGITEDGQAVLLVHRPIGGSASAYIVNENGFTWRKPPSDTADSYSLTASDLSDDSEHLFYTRRGTAFGRNGEAKVVEVYSIRHLACIRALTFGFGDGHHLRNTRLIPQLRARGTIYMGIETSSFGGDDDERNSPTLIASSDSKLHWNFAGLDSPRGSGSTFISPDDAHLFYVEPDAAMLHHWDLKHPTLRSLGSVRLPGVEYSQSRRWLIHGKESLIRDAIAEQIHRARYSPKCKVITIVTVNNSTVVVNVILTFNLQLIYHETVKNTSWPQYVPLRIGFNDSTGLNIFAMYPTTAASTNNGGLRLYGVTGILISLKDIFQKIKSIEDYFDSTSDRIAGLMKAVDKQEVIPQCQYGWKPGVMDSDDPESIPIERGTKPITNVEDSKRQREFYERVFASPGSSVRMQSTPELRHFFVPHLFSFTYPWAPNQRVSIFGVVMKNEYHIVAIGPSQDKQNQSTEVIRALYATDIKVSPGAKELIEIYKDRSNYILRVHVMDKSSSGYSGAPMPIPRWTVITPHFLEEDAWYDTFIIHRAAHVTLPSGWSHTPNPALTDTSNYHAYFLPHTFAVQEVVNYGHRARSAYVLPKYLLWGEYGLRGHRKARSNDIFFGGGRYADTLGHYFRSIYEDKTYDDSSPLFPSTFALACNADHRAQQTKHVDAFFRRLHQESNRLMENCHAVSCTLPLACRIRPMACLSFMRHITLYSHKINDVGAVEVKNGATKPKRAQYDGRWHKWWLYLEDIYYLIVGLWNASHDPQPEPNTRSVTLPLPGFCSFRYKLYKSPPISGSSMRDSPFWDFVRAAYPDTNEESFVRWETQILTSVAYSGRGAASPFTRLVEAILIMKDRELQLSFLRIAWLEKLLAWKMRTFGLKIYLIRTALPMIALFSVHLTIGVLWTGRQGKTSKHTTVSVILLACMEALVSCYILAVKIRQAHRIPRLFLRSIFNYIDGIAIALGFSMVFLTASKTAPPRAFLAFSTLLIWIAAVLMLRIYRPVGMLLLLLTETLQGVFSFLVLLFFIILGFAFVPFLLLRELSVDPSIQNPFSSFPLTFSQLLNFISSDYGALEPFETSSTAVKTLRAIYVIVITVLFLNMLIAMLNLKIKRADKNAGNLYHLQMASLQVEIELGMLSSMERERRDWFPEWFSYTMTEVETRKWNKYVEDNPLKWTEENNFKEDKDHAPLVQIERTLEDDWVQDSKPTANTAQQSSSPTRGEEQESEDKREKEAARDILGGRASSPQHQQAESSTFNDLLLDTPLEPVETATADDNAVEDSQPSACPPDNQEEKKRPCNVCQKPGMLCTGCKTVAYCGKDHQRVDWKSHKKACKGKGRAEA